MEWLKKLHFTKVTFTIQTTTEMFLPLFKGATFRGALNWNFKRLVCLNQNEECDSCVLRKTCSYFYLFETPNPGKIKNKTYGKVEHPIILEPPLTNTTDFDPGQNLEFSLILIGKAIEFLPYLVFVFLEIGAKYGLGKNRNRGAGKFNIKNIVSINENEQQIDIYNSGTNTLSSPNILTGHIFFSEPAKFGASLRIIYKTPAKINYDGRFLKKNHSDYFSAQEFLKPLFDRMVSLYCYFCDGSEEKTYFDQNNYPQINTDQLCWKDFTRRSAKQKEFLKLGGMIGEMEFTGSSLKYWLPLLMAGSFLHAGRSTIFGLGKYVLEVG